MTNTARALYDFYSGFGLPAAVAGKVPDTWDVPYITYSLVETDSLEPSTHYAQVWYRKTRNVELLSTVDQIKTAVGRGIALRCEGGYVCIRPAEPYVQIMPDENPENEYAYMNFQINCYHK